MKLEDLKNNIENKQVNIDLLIFENTENDFIMNQYVKSIAEINNLDLCYIEDISEIQNTSSLFEQLIKQKLYILKLDKLDNDNYLNYHNLIIGCNKINKEYKEVYNNYIITIPKLEEWQKKDFIYSQLDNMQPEKLDTLYKLCNGNIFRIDNEINRLKIFQPTQRDTIFESFIKDKVYDDLTTYTLFDFTNAILTKDINTISNIYKELKNIDYSSFGILTILYNSFKNIIKIQLDQNATPESTGIKSGQFWAIKYNNIGFYSKEQLIKIFTLLTDIDRQVKIGLLDTSLILDYLLVNIIGIN